MEIHLYMKQLLSLFIPFFQTASQAIKMCKQPRSASSEPQMAREFKFVESRSLQTRHCLRMQSKRSVLNQCTGQQNICELVEKHCRLSISQNAFLT